MRKQLLNNFMLHVEILLKCFSLNFKDCSKKMYSCSGAVRYLQVQSCKLYIDICMIASTQITNTEIFAFIPVLVFKLLSRKVLSINRKGSRNFIKKQGTLIIAKL